MLCEEDRTDQIQCQKSLRDLFNNHTVSMSTALPAINFNGILQVAFIALLWSYALGYVTPFFVLFSMSSDAIK